MMELSKYIACICEGGAERAVMDLLLDNDKLLFGRDRLLDEELIRKRDAKSFEQRYLRKGFTEKITVLRILDSRKENFKISKAYEHQVNVVNVITAPEIEMLVILHEKKYSEFKSSGKKPSAFCKGDLGFKEVKEYGFVKEYFKNVNDLIAAILEYRRVTPKHPNEYLLADLLK